MNICAIDPGTNKCGIVQFNTETKNIIYYETLVSKDKNYVRRIKEICGQIFLLTRTNFSNRYFIEKFAMAGNSGEMLHKFIGAVFYCLPLEGIDITEVRNTTLKKVVGGHGHCSKEDIGVGVLNYFASNDKSAAIIEHLIEQKEWDVLDAFAIGITGSET